MKRGCFVLAVFLAMVVTGVPGIYAQDVQTAPAAAASARKVYNCEACKVSMDTPGKCPVCGVELAEVVMTEEPAAAVQGAEKN